MPNPEATAAQATREAIAAEVRAELARREMSQRELGEILDLPQSAVNLRLKGTRPFKGEELVALAAAWNVPVEQFLRVPTAAAGAA